MSVSNPDLPAPGRAQAPARPMTPESRFAREVVFLAGLPFDVLTLAEAVDRMRRAALERTRCFVSTPNVNFAAGARSDPEFRDSVLRSDLSLVDGAPLVWMARRLGIPLSERVAGASVFEALCAHPGVPLNVFFFGGPPAAAEAACRSLDANPGGLRAVGFDTAGFGSVEEMSGAERLARINASGADFVIVSLGAKKGQAWIERNAAILEAPLLCHMGAVVNFAAGTVSRAPRAIQDLGLEWLWRIKEEPQLWRRYGHDGLFMFGWLLTRLLPAARSERRRPCGDGAADGGIDVTTTGGRLRVVLSGAWGKRSLDPLRTVLADAVRGGRGVELSLGAVTYVDAGFLGLLSVARGSLGAHGLALVEVPPAVRRTMRYHGAEYLLDCKP